MIGIGRDVRVLEKDLQFDALVQQGVERVGERRRRQQRHPLPLVLGPFERPVDDRFAVPKAVRALGLTAERLLADLIFDLVQALDLLQARIDRRGFSVAGFKKLTPGVRPASDRLRLVKENDMT